MRGRKDPGGWRKPRPKHQLTHRKTIEAKRRDDKRLEKRMMRNEEDLEDDDGDAAARGWRGYVGHGLHWHTVYDLARDEFVGEQCYEPACGLTHWS